MILFFSILKRVFGVVQYHGCVCDDSGRDGRNCPASSELPTRPLLLGFILGGLMEENLRRALIITDGEISFLWERPITLAFTVLAIVTLLSPLFGRLMERKSVQLVRNCRTD